MYTSYTRIRSLKTEEQVFEEFRLNQMQFNSLKCAIPKYIKEYHEEFEPQLYMPIPGHNYDIVSGKGKLASYVYEAINRDLLLIHNKMLKWNADLCNVDLSITEFAKLVKDTYAVTNIAKFRSFQYRLLLRGLVTNIQLKYWKIQESDSCSFCLELEGKGHALAM